MRSQEDPRSRGPFRVWSWGRTWSIGISNRFRGVGARGLVGRPAGNLNHRSGKNPTWGQTWHRFWGQRLYLEGELRKHVEGSGESAEREDRKANQGCINMWISAVGNWALIPLEAHLRKWTQCTSTLSCRRMWRPGCLSSSPHPSSAECHPGGIRSWPLFSWHMGHEDPSAPKEICRQKQGDTGAGGGRCPGQANRPLHCRWIQKWTKGLWDWASAGFTTK